MTTYSPRGEKLSVHKHDDGSWWIHDRQGEWDGPWADQEIAEGWKNAILEARRYRALAHLKRPPTMEMPDDTTGHA